MYKNLHRNTKDELIDEIIKLRESEEKLRDKIKDLEWKLNTNMTNSGISSSKELFNKKTIVCNSRLKWKNPKWWKKWHKWSNLKREEKVDETLHSINFHTLTPNKSLI